MANSKNMKRIHKVTIKRMADDSPDTSWLGEYANSPDSEFSIDRAHDLDCPQQTYNRILIARPVELLERAIGHLENVKEGTLNRNLSDSEKQLGLSEWESANDAQDVLIGLQDELAEECTCGFSGHWNNREYRYFNPSSNYKGESPEDAIKYVRQDYERMESLNAGHWGFIGIRAEARVSFGKVSGDSYLLQEITSGGLWGIESDSGADYLKSVEEEELAELRRQLHAVGFSQRAITAAFRGIQREEN